MLGGELRSTSTPIEVQLAGHRAGAQPRSRRWRCSAICWRGRASTPPSGSARRRAASTRSIAASTSPSIVADEVFERVLYGDHPYGHPFLGTLESVARHHRRRSARLLGRALRAAHRHLRARRRRRRCDRRDAGGRRARSTAGSRRRRRPRRRRRRRRCRRASCSSIARARRSRELRVGHLGRDAHDARLRGAVAARDGARRLVHLPAQPEPAREARLHLRRARRLRPAHRRPARSSPAAGVRTDVTAAALKETVAELAGMRAPLARRGARTRGARWSCTPSSKRSATATRPRRYLADLVAHRPAARRLEPSCPAQLAALDVPR